MWQIVFRSNLLCQSSGQEMMTKASGTSNTCCSIIQNVTFSVLPMTYWNMSKYVSIVRSYKSVSDTLSYVCQAFLYTRLLPVFRSISKSATSREIHTDTHTYIPTYIHTYIHTYIYTHTHTYIHTYIHTNKPTHTYVRTYIHTYVHTYKHTHTYATVVLYAVVSLLT
jgi:hypothetical protein